MFRRPLQPWHSTTGDRRDLELPADGSGRQTRRGCAGRCGRSPVGRRLAGLVDVHNPIWRRPSSPRPGPDDAQELVEQPGLAQGPLRRVLSQVQGSALLTRGSGIVEFVHSGLDAVDVQDAGERQAAEAAADNDDFMVRFPSPGVGVPKAPDSNTSNIQRDREAAGPPVSSTAWAAMLG